MTDRRLAPVLATIASGRVKVLSVDVFDTLLWRRVPEPRDAFLLLGRAFKATGELASHVTPVAFAELRHAAEKAARERREAATGSREILLVDIYREIPPFVLKADAKAAAAAEFEFEHGLMIRDTAIANCMSAAKAAGVRVILVSDTYFTPEQMKTFLATAGLTEGRDFDKLYASNAFGRPKWRDLFDLVLREENVAPAEILHIGDTLEADVFPCRMRGIGFAHYDKWSFAARAQTQEWPAKLAARSDRLGARGDFGLTGLRSRLFHRPPADLDPNLAPFWIYGAATLAPVFAGFARWMVATCRAEGATKIFGIMREGRFLNLLVRETATALGVQIATEELWLSRRAVVRAALSADTVGLVPEFAILSPGRSTDEMLTEMGLTKADLAAAGLPDFDITDGNTVVRKLCMTIAERPELLAKVVAVGGRHRANLLKALSRQIDLTSPGPVVVMDLGYTATIQSALQDLLARNGSPVRLEGLYLALNKKALENVRGGNDLRGYLDTEGFEGMIGKLLSRVPFVLEHACMCPEGSLSHFDEAGAPVLLPNGRDPAQIRQMEAMQAGIIAGVRQINALLGDLDATPADDAQLKALIVAIIEASHLYPTAAEAKAIGAWKHEAKVELTGVGALTDLAFDAPALEYQGWPALQEISLDQAYWPSAAFAGADPFFAEVYGAGQNDAYRAPHMNSGPVLGAVMVCPDAGAGFDERRQGSIVLAMNVFGRAELQATIKGVSPDAYHRLRFIWPRAQAVLALDEVSVVYVREEERVTRKIPGSTALWEKGQAEGAMVRANPDAVCVVDLGPPPPWPHGIELTVRLKYLRLDPLFGRKP